MSKEIKSAEVLKRKEWQLTDYLEDIEREEKKIVETVEFYHNLQNQEKRLLEEVAFFSAGTTAEASAMRSYDEQQQIEHQRKQVFLDIEDSLQKQKRALKETIEATEQQRRTLEEQERKYDKN